MPSKKTLLFDAEKYFNQLDTDKDGFLTEDEIQFALKQNGIPTTPSLVNAIIKNIDKNSDGKISHDEFISFSKKQDEMLTEVFDTFDTNNSGTLSHLNIKEALERLGQPLSDEVIDQIFAVLDKSKDGQISLDEFRTFYFLVPEQSIKAQFKNWSRGSIDIGESLLIPDDKKPGTSAMTTLIAGGVAGAISRTATAPLDRLKVVLQAQTAGQTTSISQAFGEIYKEGGVKSFFRGNGTNVIKIAPETAIKFIMYDKIKEMTCKNPKQPTTLERLISGAVAGFSSQTLIYPLEICKTRLALAQPGTYNGIGGCLKTIAAQEGPLALYKGWGASVLGIIPYASIDLAVFNTLRDGYVQKYASDPTTVTLLLCGAFSGICGQLVSYPLARVRTLLQVQGLPGRPVLYSGMGDCFVQTIKNEGPAGLYRGILPNFMKSVPAIAISYAAFEQTKKMLQ